MTIPTTDTSYQLRLVPTRPLQFRDERPRIVDAASAAQYWKDNVASLEDFETEVEVLVAIYLGAGNDAFGYRVICKGSHNAAAFNVADVFVGAIELGASAIVLAHNHPDGSIEPSPEDIRTGQRLLLYSDHCGIGLRDLLVIGLPSSVDARWWSSLRELGHLQKLDVASFRPPPEDTTGLDVIPEGETDLRFAVQIAAVNRKQSVKELLSEILLSALRDQFLHAGLLGTAPSAAVTRSAGIAPTTDPAAPINAS